MNLENARLSINHSVGRSSPYPIDLIVVHVTEGDEASVREWFNDPTSRVSAHYLVTRAGAVVQFVDEADAAWHAGRVHMPTAALVIERLGATGSTNPNGYSIGIEHEGTGKEELTDAQRAASIELIRDICRRRSIPIDRRHIVGHHEIYAPKTCPGAINVDRLVADAASPT